MKKIVLFGLLTSLVATPALAQQKRVEVSPFFGFTLSEGVDVDPRTIDGEVFNAINPVSGPSFGVGIDALLTDQISAGFLWSQQQSKLEIKGITKREVADMKVSNYHGTVTYSFGYDGDVIRPYVYGGVGATNYAPDDVMGFAIASETQLSSTWGGGVKIMPNPNVGVNLAARWTPTFIKSDPAGAYCSPYWNPYFACGCWVIPDLKYSNQFQFSGGLSFRF